MALKTKRDRLLLVLAGIFITSAIVAELISGKLFQIHLAFGGFNMFGHKDFGSFDLGTYTSIIGILPWPVVFLATDIINEFYGQKIVRRLSIITCVMIAYTFIILYFAMMPKAFTGVPDHSIPGIADDTQFNTVFGQSSWIIIGSITAFIIGQLLDSYVFWFLRERTGGKLIWLRSTGSTVISQLVDTYIVLFIAFVLSGKLSLSAFWVIGLTNYVIKLLIAIGLTPLIYLFHYIIDKYLGDEAAHEMIKKSATESLHHKVDE